jgi:5-methylcytosine-specific restriction endonuclease McrA
LCKETIKIGKNGFHCGHITSEANGGLTILENLRPLCSTCNTKMSSMNWAEYSKKLNI